MHTLDCSDISGPGVDMCTELAGVKFGKDTFLLLSILSLGLPPLACLQGCKTRRRRVTSAGLDSWDFGESSLESDLEPSLESSLESCAEKPKGWKKRS